jgi:hydrogenase expression/formation protein HypC
MCLAIPAQIVEFLDPERMLARVDISGLRRVVNVALLSGGPDAVDVGDWVLVHVGFAIAQVDEREALETRRLLEQLGGSYERELDDLEASAIE